MTGLNDGTVVAHTAARITVALNQPLSQAVARFEELVPAVDIDAFRSPVRGPRRYVWPAPTAHWV